MSAEKLLNFLRIENNKIVNVEEINFNDLANVQKRALARYIITNGARVLQDGGLNLWYACRNVTDIRGHELVLLYEVFGQLPAISLEMKTLCVESRECADGSAVAHKNLIEYDLGEGIKIYFVITKYCGEFKGGYTFINLWSAAKHAIWDVSDGFGRSEYMDSDDIDWIDRSDTRRVDYIDELEEKVCKKIFKHDDNSTYPVWVIPALTNF